MCGAECPAVPGRLAGVCAILAAGNAGYYPATVTHHSLGPPSKCREELFEALPASDLPEHGLGHSRDESLLIVPSGEGHLGLLGPFQEERGSYVQAGPMPGGRIDRLRGPTGPAEAAAPPEMGEFLASGCHIPWSPEGQDHRE